MIIYKGESDDGQPRYSISGLYRPEFEALRDCFHIGFEGMDEDDALHLIAKDISKKLAKQV